MMDSYVHVKNDLVIFGGLGWAASAFFSYLK
jgi:hypothetical protein